MRRSWRHWCGFGVFGWCLLAPVASAKKTNQAFYEEPFDLAAGGASLTRASQDGVMFANPALMPYGGKFHRWLGAEFSVLAAKQSIDSVKNFSSKSDTPASGASDGQSELVDEVFHTPLHFGTMATLAYLTNNVGFGLFTRFEPDISAHKFGDNGVPEVNFSAEAYAGAVSSFAVRPLDWFSLGVTAKYLYAAEPDITVDLSDQQRIENLTSDPTALNKEAAYGQGVGLDAGMLLFSQGYNVDYRFALKVDDIGDTALTNEQDAFKQTVHAGLGLTLHTSADALHLSADYRDILGAYNESWFKRLYLGAKIVLRTYVGLAAGLYQGYPSYGLRVDLLVIKFGFSVYGRELGDRPGVAPRNIYLAYFGMGI